MFDNDVLFSEFFLIHIVKCTKKWKLIVQYLQQNTPTNN